VVFVNLQAVKLPWVQALIRQIQSSGGMDALSNGDTRAQVNLPRA